MVYKDPWLHLEAIHADSWFRMARIAAFSIFIVAVAASSACAGLVPGIPNDIPTPKSKGEAIGLVRRGSGAGKAAINLRINAVIQATNNDASLTPESKQCIVEKAKATREATLDQIDKTADSIVSDIEAASLAWVPVWIEVIEDLPSLILTVLADCRNSLDAARTDCIAQAA